jgi:hypothetical protein
MMMNDLGPVRHLGRIAMTPGVTSILTGEDVWNALVRHMHLMPDIKCLPALGGLEGCRVLRVYRSSAGRPFWIITEADKAVTTVLMPEEFSSNLSCRNQNQFEK